jgi:hypothetical protein
MFSNLSEILINIGLVLVVFIIIIYLMYSVGLAKVFAKLGEVKWKAFVPLYNFKTLIEVLHLPSRWFVLSLTPYIGTVYSVAVAYRLGRVFGKSLVYSSVWLIVGSPIGMLQIGFSNTPLHLEVIKEPPPNIKDIERRLMRNKKDPSHKRGGTT